jgi:hypothetical protein
MSIFLAIPSYCDPVLAFTLASAYEKAKFPEQLHFGVIDQSPMDAAYPVPAHIPAAQVSYIKIDAKQARGCCWARYLAMSLYREEDWFFQLDSHMMFAQDWDDILVRKMQTCLHFSESAVISGYPASFSFVDGVATVVHAIEPARAIVVNPGTVFHPDHPYFAFKVKTLYGVGAVEGFHIAGGCLFAPGDYARVMPVDPFLYFNEEEQNIALRLYTHGWDIYHVAGLPIYHLYNAEPEITGTKRRPLHWDIDTQLQEEPKWWALERRAKKRLSTLVWGDSDTLGAYGLGTERSLAEYADMCGINYATRTISQKAFDGPWDVPAMPIPPNPTA